VEVTLTDEQISVLDRHIDKFRAGNYQDKERIVNRLLRRFKGDLDEDEFDALAVQTGDKGTYSTNQRLDGPRNVRTPFTH